MKCLPREKRAFSLIEILVSISIIAILASLALVSFRRTLDTADRVKCLSNLRTIGTAVLAYAGDNNNMHPGPLWVGQVAYYANFSYGSLAYYLWPYLELPEPGPSLRRADILVCPAWRKRVNTDGGAVYLMQQKALSTDGKTIQPCGYPKVTPVSSLLSIANRSATPIMFDLDQVNGGGGYVGNAGVPALPAHGNVRNAVFFDGHAESVPINSSVTNPNYK